MTPSSRPMRPVAACTPRGASRSPAARACVGQPRAPPWSRRSSEPPSRASCTGRTAPRRSCSRKSWRRDGRRRRGDDAHGPAVAPRAVSALSTNAVQSPCRIVCTRAALVPAPLRARRSAGLLLSRSTDSRRSAELPASRRASPSGSVGTPRGPRRMGAVRRHDAPVVVVAVVTFESDDFDHSLAASSRPTTASISPASDS